MSRPAYHRCSCGEERDRAAWERLRLDGYLELAADEHGPAMRLEHRTCDLCWSTGAVDLLEAPHAPQ
jgi:hypothetical protein